MVQLSYPYMATGKTIALTRWTFVGKAMSLLFNMLSRLVIAFLPRSKHLLITWLQSQCAVTFQFSSVQSLSRVQLFVTPWIVPHQASNSRSILKLMSIASVMSSNHLNLCHPLLLPSIFPSIRVFSNESVLCIRWSKYWSFSFFPSISKEQTSFNLIVAVTICNDLGAQNNKVCQCFHCFPIYLPWSDRIRCLDLRFLNVEF